MIKVIRFSIINALLILLSTFGIAFATVREPVRANECMVATVNGYATKVGLDVLYRGGNAVDAAAAVAMSLAVVHPVAGNLGGGGFMLIRLTDGSSTMIDFRERAPLAARRGMYVDSRGTVVPKRSTEGVLATGVPGTVAGIALALNRYGTRSFADTCRPAERLAREGVILSRYEADHFLRENEKLGRYPESRRIFLRNGNYYSAGERFRQPELADTFRRMIKNGPREFYEGKTARMIVKAMGADGLIIRKDLKDYRAVERTPLRGSYRGFEIITAPPPSSGGVAIIEMLNMLEGYEVKAKGHNSAACLHLLTEVMRRAFADRAYYLGDPDYSAVPVTELTDKRYAAILREGIDPAMASDSASIGPGRLAGREPEHTTHFSVVDKYGTMVSCTYTINDNFGNGVTVPGAGFLLNDEMDDFASQPGDPSPTGPALGEANSIVPGKRPRSSMTPTIVLREGQPWFAIGSPGGPRIINAVLQVIINIIDFGMNLQQAIDMPRIHHQWRDDQIVMEPGGLTSDTVAALKAKGHKFAERQMNIGHVQGVMIEATTSKRIGGSDARVDGLAMGF